MLQAHPHGARSDPGSRVRRSPASLGPRSPRRAQAFARGDFRRAWGLGLLVPWPRPHRAAPRRRTQAPAADEASVLPAEEYKSDLRLSLYQSDSETEERRRLYESELLQKALCDEGLPLDTPCKCDVHYSWACLERLQQAKDLGRRVTVGSVLLPPSASEAELALSRRCSDAVFRASGNLIDAGLARKGSRKNFCRFAVAYPMSKPLGDLSPPFLVIDQVSSSHSLGQILRTAYHFGIESVVLTEVAWAYMDALAFRVSMGWAYHLDFHFAKSLCTACSELQGRGLEIYGLSQAPSAPDVQSRTAEEKSWVLLLGCQEHEAALGKIVSWIGIPRHLEGTMDLAHASAICMYELAGLSSA